MTLYIPHNNQQNSSLLQKTFQPPMVVAVFTFITFSLCSGDTTEKHSDTGTQSEVAFKA